MSDDVKLVGKFEGGAPKKQSKEKRGKDVMDMAFAKEVGRVLHMHYPNYGWRVDADTQRKTIHVLNIDLSGEWGFVLHMNKIANEADLEKKVMRAGGEILERYGLSRLGFNANEYALLEKNDLGENVFQE